MKTLLLPVILLSLVLAAPANGQTPNEPGLPYTPSLDVNSMDKSIDPCSNFYQYACGGWRKKNPIPPDQTSWSVYGKLYQDNLNFLRRILEQASSSTNQRDAVTQQIGDFYAACVDEAGIEKSGPDPIKLELEAIARLNSVRELAPLVARLQMATGGYRSILFRGGSDQDPDDSEHMIASLDQGGLGLPDRDYYTKEDAKSKETREQYVKHVQKIFELLGDNAETAKKNGETLMRMETALAKASMARVERRNPYNLKHKMEIPGLEELAPNFDWKAYYRVLQYPKIEILNVGDPAFFKQVNAALASEPLANWKTYLRFHVADSSAQYLSAKFVQENFDFYRKYLRGAKEQQPRWKRCVQYTDYMLGEALGQAYVRTVFSPELKQNTLDMVRRIEDAMAKRIEQLDWMSPETKQQALTKLKGIRNKIGYPDISNNVGPVKSFLNALLRFTPKSGLPCSSLTSASTTTARS